MAIVVGDLLGSPDDESASIELEALLNGQIDIPLPTYFMIGDSSFPETVKAKLEHGDLCSNLFYLGRKGTMTTTEGVRIVSLGGRLAQNEASLTQKPSAYDPLYLDSESRGLHGAHSAHILVTNQWPANITNGSKVELPEGVDGTAGSQSVANLCQALKPWYHFSSSPSALWEREPFKHVVEYTSYDQPSVTRFKSLPSVSASTKEWMSAFTLDTSRPPATVETPLESPFIRSSPPRKRQAVDDRAPYRGDADEGNGARNRKRARRGPRYDPDDCFMCLNKPGAKTHLVVSLGDESMATTTRGPLPLPSTFPQLSFTGHVMIIPYYHAADELAHGKRSPDEIASEFREMNRFRKALSAMIGAKSHGQLGAVCWEVNRTGIRHFHWQIVACPVDRIKTGMVEAAFKVKASQYGYPDFQTCAADTQLPQRSDYFRVWTWVADAVQLADHANGNANDDEDVGVAKSMFFPLPVDQKFNIWFGREVMAGLLQLEYRVNWMDSILSKDGSDQAAEEEDAAGLRADFEEFDFAMK
ncbi:hypothetical protein AYO22_11678 [Fonsecaea multimorphosa]|nr:hypothetical protein AYO22_11678 [Fonsecaea multimorphosa]